MNNNKTIDGVSLLPCPFCGQSDFLVEQLDSDASVVICQGLISEHCACLARGPVGVQDEDDEGQSGRSAAVREWNTRAAPVVERQEPIAWVVTDMNGDFYFACDKQTPSDEPLHKAPPQLAELQATIERQAVEIVELKRERLAMVPDRDLLRDKIAEAIGGDAYDCARVWSAWGVGTMDSDDFTPIIEQEDRLYEIVDACLDATAALNGKPK